jgi:hypothetical protein
MAVPEDICALIASGKAQIVDLACPMSSSIVPVRRENIFVNSILPDSHWMLVPTCMIYAIVTIYMSRNILEQRHACRSNRNIHMLDVARGDSMTEACVTGGRRGVAARQAEESS